jgi:hypothetical protein
VPAPYAGCPRPGWKLSARVLEEEAQHLPRGVRPSRVGVGASGAASRPGVSGAMDLPVLKDCPPARVGMDCAGICMSAGNPTAMYFLLQVRSLLLRNDMIAVARVHCAVSMPMKNDGRNSGSVPRDLRSVARPRKNLTTRLASSRRRQTGGHWRPRRRGRNARR